MCAVLHTDSNRKGSKLLLSLRQKPYFLFRFMFHTQTRVCGHTPCVSDKKTWNQNMVYCKVAAHIGGFGCGVLVHDDKHDRRK